MTCWIEVGQRCVQKCADATRFRWGNIFARHDEGDLKGC